MFKYILLCSLLVHSIWAKPVEHQQQIDEALPSNVVVVTPQSQVSVDTLFTGGTPIIHHAPLVRFVGPQEESVVYVPVRTIHNNDAVARSLSSNSAVDSGLQSSAEAIYQGINQFAQEQAQAQKQLQLQQQQQQLQQQQLLLIQQQQKIQQLEQQLQPQKQTQTQLFSIETPLASAGVSLPGSDLLNAVSGTVGSVSSFIPNLLSPLVKQKSLSVYGNEPRHHYFVEQPHHQVVEYVPVLSSVPVTTSTIKTRRSIVAVDENDLKNLKESGEDIKPADEEKKYEEKPEDNNNQEEPQNIKLIEVIKPAELEQPASNNDENSPDIFVLGHLKKV